MPWRRCLSLTVILSTNDILSSPARKSLQPKQAFPGMPLIRDSGERGKAYARRSRSTHMSMREFEREAYGSEDDADYLSKDSEIPADFSIDDVVFAHELDALFNVEKEEAPPLFAQTLLGPHNPQFQMAGDGFE